MRTRTALLWWVGWNPIAAAAVGIFAGVVVGNVLLTWGVRAAMLGGGVSRYGESALGPFVGDGAGYLLSLAFVPVLSAILAGVAIGGVLWYLGVRTINRRAETVVERTLDSLDETTGVTTTGTLTQGRGSVPLVDVHREYTVSLVRLDEDAASVTRYELQMPDRRTDRTDTVRIPYDEVDSVRYDGTSLNIDAWGREFATPVSESPTEVLEAFRDRCRMASGSDSNGS